MIFYIARFKGTKLPYYRRTFRDSLIETEQLFVVLFIGSEGVSVKGRSYARLRFSALFP